MSSHPAPRATPLHDPVERRVLRDGVLDRLVEILLGGRFAPGASLSIDGLARELGVSPTPVREALAQLEHTGLVSRVALRGYRVSPPLTTSEIEQLNDARSIVELGALDKALAREEPLAPVLMVAHEHHLAVVASIKDLPPPTDEIERIARYRGYYNADWDFHLAIMRHADNRFILQMADSLGAHVHRLRQSVQLGLNDMTEATTEHARILRAIENNDADQARQAMRDHLHAVRSRSIADRTEALLHTTGQE